MKRLALVIALVFCTPAHADRLVQFPMPDPPPPVIAAGCPGDVLKSCTGPGQPIYLATTDRRDYWHEMGHQFDYTRLDDGERNRFRRAIREQRPWVSSPNSPHEQFAEAYTVCALGVKSNGYTYWRQPSRVQRWACGFILRAAD